MLPFLVALFILGLSAIGVVAPAAFMQLVAVFQQRPVIYLAAFVRFTLGIILFRASSSSRAPRLVRLLGAAIAVGGLITPFVGVWIGQRILGWWQAGGDPIVRIWAGAGVLLGIGLSIALRPGSVPSRLPRIGAPDDSI